MTKVSEKLETISESGVEPYVAPQLRLVGNLNDLLAGTGTQNSDNAQSCTAGSAFFVAGCEGG